MKSQNNVALAALAGIVVGALLGAGTAQYAHLIAYYDKDTALERDNMPYSSSDILRNRSDLSETYEIAPRSPTREQARDAAKNLRDARGAAPVSSEDESEGCDRFKFGSPRHVKCIVELEKYGQEYQQSQTPR